MQKEDYEISAIGALVQIWQESCKISGGAEDRLTGSGPVPAFDEKGKFEIATEVS